MANNSNSLPEGAGATSGTSSMSGSRSSSVTSGGRASGPRSSSYDYDDVYAGSSSSGREVILAERSRNKPSMATIVGAAVAGAIAGGAIPFMLSGRSSSSNKQRENEQVEQSVTIDKPARELYDFWRDFTNLSKFMENIESVEKLDDKRSHWVIKAPAGTSVEFDSFVTQDIPGKLIAWRSEEDASVPNRGRVEFIEAGPRSTIVRTSISYDPPAGKAGKMVAKLFHREPSTQAREDLNRLKRLMETGRADA